ncbi:DUF4235 domain-containing protein [Williamsia sp. 1135]|uniref:DUF4235 domain-containing protein n=1 Tax=Williamsia sp. 1135 TaxID=1889262 RepID=UPI000A10D73A|nr:DUF4235 domain-containing protein [Williamsia sp. 1135]ORM25158.1 hypothetical protein BFL43_25880 [Williamsia sp. 1135]
MTAVSKTMYKPLSIASGVVGGLAATAVFGQVWKRLGDNDAKAPRPSDLSRSNTEVFAAAAIQGLIVGLVRAAIDRAAARGYKAVTHEDPT